jgi:hypothetical protein
MKFDLCNFKSVLYVVGRKFGKNKNIDTFHLEKMPFAIFHTSVNYFLLEKPKRIHPIYQQLNTTVVFQTKLLYFYWLFRKKNNF